MITESFGDKIEFAKRIVRAAQGPRHKRAGLNEVVVTGRLKPEGNASGSESYRFNASFANAIIESTIRGGELREYITRYDCPEVYVYQTEEPRTDVPEYVINSLNEIAGLVRGYGKKLNVRVEGSADKEEGKLIVDAFWLRFDKKQ